MNTTNHYLGDSICITLSIWMYKISVLDFYKYTMDNQFSSNIIATSNDDPTSIT